MPKLETIKPSFARFKASFRDADGGESWRRVPYECHPAAVKLFETECGHDVPCNTPFFMGTIGGTLGVAIAWLIASVLKAGEGGWWMWALAVGGMALGMFSPFLAILWARRWYLFPDERERFKTESREGRPHF